MITGKRLKYKIKKERAQKRRVTIMKKFNYVITDEVGIHARPASLLVKEVKKYASKVTIEANGKSVDASKLMAVMSLGVKNGAEVTVSVEGEDEETACAEIEEFFKANL